MKKLLFFLFLTFGSLIASAQNYLVLWNSIEGRYHVQQVNTSTGSVTTIGYTSSMSGYTSLDQIYYDATNNQLVGLYEETDLWKYNLANNTDAMVDLGTSPYRCLVMAGSGNAYLLQWNSTNFNYEIKTLNLSTGVKTDAGSTTQINSHLDLDEVFYDEVTQLLFGLMEGTDLWTYSITGSTDAVVDITGSDSYRSLATANQVVYLLKWNTDKYEVYTLNPTSGAVSLVGSSTTVTDMNRINEVYYDVANNQLVALHNYNSLWRYNLGDNTDVVTSLGGADDYRDLGVYNAPVSTPVIDPVTLSEKEDEVVKMYDLMGREVSVLETGRVLILVYKSGKVKKVLVQE